MRSVGLCVRMRIGGWLAAALAVASCTERQAPTQPAPSTLRIDAATDMVLLNRTLRLAARSTAHAPDTGQVTWTSSDTLIATIDTSGLVRTKSLGAVTLSARRGTNSATFTLRVGLQRIDLAAPVAIAGESNWASCVITTNGRPYCSGRPVDSVPQFRALTGAPGARFTSIASGLDSYCGLDTNGQAWCWGRNSHGQFGIPLSTQFSSDSAFPVASNMRFKRLTTGGHSQVCGIALADDVVYCWGHNDTSQLGRGPAGPDIPTLGPVLGELRASEIATSNGFSCALDLQGRPWCWGQASLDPTFTGAVPAPRLISGSPALHDLNMTESSACALDASGAAWCWGSNQGGRLGVGSTDAVAGPAAVIGGIRFRSLRATGNMCGVSVDSDVYCWGAAPVRLTRDIKVRSIAFGASFCVVTTDDQLYCS